MPIWHGMNHMNSMAMVTDQLKAVAHYADWSNHSRHMEDVDAELIEINQQIQTVIFLRDMVGQIDDQLFRKIANGEIAPTTDGIGMFLEANELFAGVCRDILPKAEEFARKGFSVEALSRFRSIAADPAAGLAMIEIARGA